MGEIIENKNKNLLEKIKQSNNATYVKQWTL